MEFRFTDGLDPEEVLDQLRGPRLWMPNLNDIYPGYGAWVERAYGELQNGVKIAFSGVYNGENIGLLLFQRDKANVRRVEIKSVAFTPQLGQTALGRRGIASFALEQVVREARVYFPGAEEIVCDGKVSNVPIRRLFVGSGFRESSPVRLYGEGTEEDVVFSRRLQANKI